MNKIKITDSS